MRSLLAIIAALALTSCQTLECGENTIERDGKCVAETTPPGAECGPGTYYDQGSGRCVSTLIGDGGGLCGENTIIVINDAGLPVCVGTGGPGTDCNQPIACPQPTEPNSMTICGRIYDLEDTTPLDDGNPTNGEPYQDIELRIYDPLAYATNPSAPIVQRSSPDSCARFAITNIPLAQLGSGFVAVVSEDAGADDNFVLAGIADVATAGMTLTDRRAWVFRRSTDMMWSTGAGLVGETFGTRGVYVPIFLSGTPLAPFTAGRPTTGVKVAFVDPTTTLRTLKPDQDFYFDDTSPLLRQMASPTRDATGPNGTGLFIMTSLANHSGLGAEPPSTCWRKDLAASPRGGAFVQERIADTRDCP